MPDAEQTPFAMAQATDRGRLSPRSKIDRYRQLRASLDEQRTSFIAHWRDLADFILPRRLRINPDERNRGEKRNQNIVDSAGRLAARTLQSGLHSGLTSPARPWFKLSTHNQSLSEQQPVKEWLHTVTSRMLQLFLQTNLYNALPIVYGDMGTFATAAMAVLPDEKDLFRCYTYPIGSYWLGLDARGVVTTFMREYTLSVRQVVEQFALREDKTIDRAKLSANVLNAWDRNNTEESVAITWIVTPNDEDYDPDGLEAKQLKWASCYFESDGRPDRFLKESGFPTFPVLAPRWETTGEDAYGTDCPGMLTLPDIRQLQVMVRRKAQGVHKMIDPPLVAPPSIRTQKTSLLPGDVTYVDDVSGNQVRAIHEVGINLEHLARDIYDIRQRIAQGFFQDLFLMLAQSDAYRGSQPITAEEVRERHEEKLLALGPVLERTNDELLDPLIDRTFQLMLEAGLFPPPPAHLEGVNLKVEYTSIMAQAQKLVGVVGVDRFFMSLSPMVATFPAIVNKINIEESVDFYGEALGVPPKLIRPTEEAQAIAAQQAQAQQQAMQAEQLALQAKAAKDAAGASMEGDTALSRMASAMGAPTGPVRGAGLPA